jgi:hypothetical protein
MIVMVGFYLGLRAHELALHLMQQRFLVVESLFLFFDGSSFVNQFLKLEVLVNFADRFYAICTFLRRLLAVNFDLGRIEGSGFKLRLGFDEVILEFQK